MARAGALGPAHDGRSLPLKRDRSVTLIGRNTGEVELREPDPARRFVGRRGILGRV